MSLVSRAFTTSLRTFVAVVLLYASFITLLTIPYFQDHIIYLHRVTLTWFSDVNIPEQWGFLRNQVTPFHLTTPDGETLHAWHILPLQTHHHNRDSLIREPTGLSPDIKNSVSFNLLRKDPDARVVLFLHGAGGTLASGWRPESYRALSAYAHNVHVLAIDYRGFGSSTGWPSEDGLLTDALTLVDFAMQTAGIPAERIVVFAQSLGTGVAISLAHHLAMQDPPVVFAGMVLVAPFASVEMLTETYKVAGLIPLLSPIARIPWLLGYLNGFIETKFASKERLEDLIRHLDSAPSSIPDGMEKKEVKYVISIIHAEDDFDIPWVHSEILFWGAVNGMRSAVNETTLGFDELQRKKEMRKLDLGDGGWEVEWQSPGGVVREQILKHGLHNWIKSYPVVSLAVARAFEI
ncbi:abhydrolase domain-containing protein 12 [Lophiostoma macrostomum CBS 122681]|uniref:Abhydrolase domain-containing protein 12 n=1 Tax=Lophiostoma macrostomum CBS 122681 TaxID=1314788 RepID=A0A6A6SLK9_9PLEO|nr:abhydrolase domain-containing protein 12 [Lophiostoma macrostomum CBS 122681]